jgi:plastocyanin
MPALAALATLGWIAAASQATARASEHRGASNAVRVVIKDFMYTPGSLAVKAGTTVTWVNRDGEPHTVVSSAGLFRSGGMDTNEAYSFKFDQPGTYIVVCSIHPRMVETIVVEP